jgi:hypothetical protein
MTISRSPLTSTTSAACSRPKATSRTHEMPIPSHFFPPLTPLPPRRLHPARPRTVRPNAQVRPLWEADHAYGHSPESLILSLRGSEVRHEKHVLRSPRNLRTVPIPHPHPSVLSTPSFSPPRVPRSASVFIRDDPWLFHGVCRGRTGCKSWRKLADGVHRCLSITRHFGPSTRSHPHDIRPKRLSPAPFAAPRRPPTGQPDNIIIFLYTPMSPFTD